MLERFAREMAFGASACVSGTVPHAHCAGRLAEPRALDQCAWGAVPDMHGSAETHLALEEHV